MIKALVLDFDGVLTDGGVWWGPGGQEWKRLSFTDLMGLSLAVQTGLLVAVISGEMGPASERLVDKFPGIIFVGNCKDKRRALVDLMDRCHLEAHEICYMGDDVNDVPAMQLAGVAAAPCDARSEALFVSQVITEAPGGNGAVRELVDKILAGMFVA